MAGDRSTHRGRSSEDDLRMAREQVHVYEAIVTAMDDAHAVLDILLGAADPDDARQGLQARYGFTEVQARAVLDVQFRRLASSDRQTIRDRLREVAALVRELGDG